MRSLRCFAKRWFVRVGFIFMATKLPRCKVAWLHRYIVTMLLRFIVAPPSSESSANFTM